MVVTLTDYRRWCALLGQPPDETISPADRSVSLPPWCQPELLQTSQAEDKLRAFASRRNRLSAEDVLVDLHAYGDAAITRAIARVLADRLPPPVTGYLMAASTWLSAGLTIGGFCGPPIPYGARPVQIVVTTSPGAAPKRLDDLIAHEAAHAWLLPEPSAQAELWTAFKRETVHTVPLRLVPADAVNTVRAIRDVEDLDERQAKRLARAWGFDDL